MKNNSGRASQCYGMQVIAAAVECTKNDTCHDEYAWALICGTISVCPPPQAYA